MHPRPFRWIPCRPPAVSDTSEVSQAISEAAEETTRHFEHSRVSPLAISNAPKAPQGRFGGSSVAPGHFGRFRVVPGLFQTLPSRPGHFVRSRGAPGPFRWVPCRLPAVLDASELSPDCFGRYRGAPGPDRTLPCCPRTVLDNYYPPQGHFGGSRDSPRPFRMLPRCPGPFQMLLRSLRDISNTPESPSGCFDCF